MALGREGATVRVEYDHENNLAIAVEVDGQVNRLLAPRVLGSKTEWIPAEVRYPSGYVQQYAGLLHEDTVRYTYDEALNKVIVEYPDADFSPEALRAEILYHIKASASRALLATDWVVTRWLEIGTPIPGKISAERNQIRAAADQRERELERTADADLLSFSADVTTPGNLPPARVEPAQVVALGGDGSEYVTDATAPEDEGRPVRQAYPNERQNGDAR